MYDADCQRGAAKGKQIRHLCGNPHCLEPKHLKIGTPKENADDKRKHGRQIGMSGEVAKQIWDFKGSLTQKELAKKFNVSLIAVEKIHQQKTHKYLHITEEN